jgi:hypothetical protein
LMQLCEQHRTPYFLSPSVAAGFCRVLLTPGRSFDSPLNIFTHIPSIGAFLCLPAIVTRPPFRVAADPRALAKLSAETLQEIEVQAAVQSSFFNANRSIWCQRRVAVGPGGPAAQPGDPEVPELGFASCLVGAHY